MKIKVNVECLVCHKTHVIREYTTLNPNYTGMCKSCMLRSPNNLSKNLHHTKSLGADIKIQGYVQLTMPTHPRATKRGFVPRCYLVMEEQIGRHIRRNEHVHHINGIKDDDRAGNLVLLSAENHIKLHAIQRKMRREQLAYLNSELTSECKFIPGKITQSQLIPSGTLTN